MLPLEAREVPAAGFFVETVKADLGAGLSVRFAEDGKVWVGEKGGTVKVYDNLNDPTATVVLDLKKNVHNYWDRGLMGMALHPDFDNKPYLYVLYTYDADIGGQAPKFGTAEYDSDPFPDPTLPGSTVSGRLSRFLINDDLTAGPEQVLVEDWPQQFTSHSVGHVQFGPDGALYVSGGDGASFTTIDYGQFNNPFNEPVNEGGALRSQDLESPGDPVTLAGTFIRVDPETGAALPDNPLYGNSDPNAKRIIGYGARNPFRFTFRPGTNEIWFTDVGWNTYEEVNRMVSVSDDKVDNFGWPAYEGPDRQPGYDAAGLPLLEQLYMTPDRHSAPYFAYDHKDEVVPGSGETVGGSSVAGIAFNTSTNFPAEYQNALFFSDYSRQAIYVMKAGANGLPDTNQIELVAPGQVGAAIDLQFGPNGDLYFIDIYQGALKRLGFSDENRRPVPILSTNTTSGTFPLTVQFDASQSYDLDQTDTLTFAWDLDGDGAFDDSTLPNPSFTYTQAGTYNAQVRVTDSFGESSIASKMITVTSSQTLRAFIDTPTVLKDYAIGSTISFSGRALDADGNQLPASVLRWTIDIRHANVNDPTSVHTHRLQVLNGVASGSFLFPDHEYPSYVEITLDATYNGETVSQKIRIDAKPYSILMNSNVPGVVLSLSSEALPTPYTRFAFDQSLQTISAPPSATIGGQQYQFVGWSDGVTTALRSVTITGNRAFTANYQLVTTGPAPTVNFSGGFATGTGTLSLNGNASVDGTRLRLTDTINQQLSSVFTKDKVNIKSFETTFDLLITDALGDGMTFVIQNQAPTSLGYGGGGLGYGGINNSVAIKFDLYNNGGEGNNSTGLYSNGAEPGPTNSVTLAASGIDLHSNTPKRVTLSYNGTTLTQTIRDLTTNATTTRTYTVNIAELIGSETAYVGFTASTGGVNARQEVATWTFTSTGTTTPVTPVPPANPKVEVPGYVGGTTAPAPLVSVISWTAVPNATGYRIERKNVGASTYTLLTTINNGATTSFNDTLVTTGRSYYYRVLAFNATGDSPYAAVLRANIPGVALAPTNLKSYVTGSSSIKLTWTDNATNETGYQILRSVAGGPMTLLTHVPAGSTNFTDTNLTPNTQYTYRVQAFNLVGPSGNMQTTASTGIGKAPQINFTGGFSSTTGLTLNGSATAVDGRLRLTNGQAGQLSSVFSTNKVSVANFQTSFDITNTNALGDGMAFVIQGQAPTAQGYGGGGLGYGGITNSVAIKLDLFNNGGEGTSSTGLYTNGAEPGPVNSSNLLTAGIDLRNSNPKRVTLSYNGVILTQTIRDLVTGSVFTRRYTVNITGLVGGNTAYVGFTASAGGVSAIQEVTAWNYTA